MANNPNIIIFHGDDNEAIELELDKIGRSQAEGGLSELNFSTLDGKSLSGDDFSNAAFALPFLSEKRVVILSNPLALAGGRDGNQKFLKLLESIPESTILYLVVPDVIERKDWAVLGKSSFLKKWIEKNPEKAEIIERKLPTIQGMREWIMKKAAAMGGRIESPAAQAIVTGVGNDTRQASFELEKLLLYVNYERPVDITDVQEIVTGSMPVSVFDMVDALVAGNARDALRTLHRLFEDQEIPVLFSMIIRQFRLLIQTKEILNERGSSDAIQKELNQVPFVADKLARQASIFTIDQLISIYQKLLEMDFEFKTSQTDPKASLDTFIAEVALILQKRLKDLRI
ncbi:MAG: DNA polymerase III subunit delta [Flexilinea sp.]